MDDELSIEGSRARDLAAWLRWADADYLASRFLLQRGFLIQGVVLANTALEKYLKMIILMLGGENPGGHKVAKLYASLKERRDNDIALNEGFLAFLQKAYELRYPDNLEEGFNIVLSEMKSLAQLDRSVLEIVGRITMPINDDLSPSLVHAALAAKNAEVLGGNVAIDPGLIMGKFMGPSRCTELRKYKNHFLERSYTAMFLSDDQSFDCEALAPQPDGSFKLAYQPVRKVEKT